MNGILGGLVNRMSIINQTCILLQTKYKVEKTEISLNEYNEIWINIKEIFYFIFLIINKNKYII